jgi:hypothetical protein
VGREGEGVRSGEVGVGLGEGEQSSVAAEERTCREERQREREM